MCRQKESDDWARWGCPAQVLRQDVGEVRVDATALLRDGRLGAPPRDAGVRATGEGPTRRTALWGYRLEISRTPLKMSSVVSEVVSLLRPRISLICSIRSEEHTSELQSLMRISYAVFCLKKKNS